MIADGREGIYPVGLVEEGLVVGLAVAVGPQCIKNLHVFGRFCQADHVGVQLGDVVLKDTY